jgi:hypothetical protein
VTHKQSQIDAWLPWPSNEMRVFSERTPDNLVRAAEQFHVEAHVRYRAWMGKTWCNIFAWDFTRALGCEIPHWVTADGNSAPPFGPGARETTANMLAEWLWTHGAAHGWRPVESRELAAMRADLGYPTVAVWRNPNATASGHIALMLPNDIVIQAGTRNGRMPLEVGFGRHVKEVLFYTHD